jgi:AraC-like DNA-binding protein
VAPAERAVWIPAGTTHSVRMVGDVSTRSAMIAPGVCEALGRTSRVVAVSPLLRNLLLAAAEIPILYDVDGRDGLVAALLLAELAAAPMVPLAVPFPASPAMAARCHAFLEAPDAGQSIDDWSAALGMNRRRFTRAFRRETGMSFAEWRQQACLLVALPRLGAGEPVTTVALDLGYDSPSAFTTMFKRLLGMSPSRYRLADAA